MSKNALRGRARSTSLNVLPLLGRQFLPLAAVVIALWLMRDRLPDYDGTQMIAAMRQVSGLQWGLALVASSASFWAVGRYDQVLHGLLGTGISRAQARYSGTVAIAVAQFAGFGVLSGALVRWRLLPDLSLLRAIRLSLAVSVSFLFGWSVVLALAVLGSGFELFHSREVAWGILGSTAILALLLLVQPSRFAPLPGVRALSSIIGLSFVDTAFACGALYILLPAGVEIAPLSLFAVFLISLGAGLIGGTPGGVGPFELALIMLLPEVEHASLLASILAFRMVYYVIPAGVGAALLIFGPLGRVGARAATVSRTQDGAYQTPMIERLLWTAPRAEMNLIRQGEFRVVEQNGRALALVAPVGQNLMMLADPLRKTIPAGSAIKCLAALAAQRQRVPLIYKCSAKCALGARAAGWHLLAIAKEAWITPATFDTNGPAHRQLRRLLKKAASAGVTTIEGGGKLPLDAMENVSADWARAHGGERGFTMGRFGRDYVNCQRVFLAYQDEKLLAFITLHEVEAEWTIDLMRQVPDAPAGTMHMLVAKAIQSAAARHCPRLSLAAVADPRCGDNSIIARFQRWGVERSGGDGLRRFKSSFAPHWETLYCAAPTRRGLLLGLAAVYLRVNRSAPCTTRNHS